MLPAIYPVACHTDNIGFESTFVAIKGMRSDGISFIPLALKKGAKKIVVEQTAYLSTEILQLVCEHSALLIKVSNTRQALAELSAQALFYPAKKLRIIGITGTKGKTTTSFLLEHVFRTAGYRTALISSIYNKINDTILHTNLTTPHPDFLHVFFDQCVKENIEIVVMEVAAQAISLDRVYDIIFDGILFTNFSLEHLEFYQSLEEYFSAKCKLFLQAKKNAPILINGDDEWCKKVMLLNESVQSFGFENTEVNTKAQWYFEQNEGIIVKINDSVFKCPTLLGKFNAYNIFGVIAFAQALNLSDDVIKQGLTTFSGVPGRLEQYILSNGAQCFIDKAHNPSSYQAVLCELRSMTQHLIVVFGAGGERDKSKRPLMGKIASEYADLVILTSDDPRTENPQDIINDILFGIADNYKNNIICQIDREQAIRMAYQHSKAHSIIVLLGKGTDEYQLINGKKLFFSEREIVHSL
ncbi:MAG: UDP-N-acetylmuramoyl-L-alanyl-D-glutamate--2,6-diaminopimelate ligase [Candidatus Babeliales bacterium]